MVTISIVCWTGVGFDIDAVQVPGCSVAVVIVVAAALVVATAVVDDGPVDVVGVDPRVVTDVFATVGVGVLLPPPPHAANAAVNVTTTTMPRKRANDLTNEDP